MDTTFMDSENIKASDPHRLTLYLSDKRDLQKSDKYVDLSNLGICYTLKNIKKQYKNNKLKRSAPTCNGKLELPDTSYSVLDFKVYFNYIIKKLETLTDNSNKSTCK